jgi:serine/threonine protein kinase
MFDGGRLKPGQVLAGKYRIDEEIAKGGGGIVYAAHQLGMDRPTVVKTLLPSEALDEDALFRFEREARVASQLQHPHAVTILEFGHEDGIAYMVMERLEGRTIREVVQEEGAMSPARVLGILKATLECVGAAHKLGIVHRDIKPANVFLCEYHGTHDFVKVIDFGIAKVVGTLDSAAEQTISQPGGVMGTPGYLAPEQLAGKPAGTQADLYAIGVIGHEMLTGQKAFKGSTPLEKLTQQALGELVEAPPEVLASPLYRVVTGLLQPRLTDRYPTAERALDDLRDLPPLSDVVLGSVQPEPPRLAPSSGGQGLSDDLPRPHIESVEARTEPSQDFFEYASQVISEDAGSSVPPPRSPMIALYLTAGALLALVGLGGVALHLTAGGEMTPADVAATDGGRDADAEPSIAVTVKSEPPGAQVVGADGTVLGETPLELKRSLSGPLDVTLKRRGYTPETVTIPPSGPAQVTTSLKRRTWSKAKRASGSPADDSKEAPVAPDTQPVPSDGTAKEGAKDEYDLQPWKKKRIRLGP